MRNGDGSIAEVLKPNGRSYNPKRWRITISYTVEQIDELRNVGLDRRMIRVCQHITYQHKVKTPKTRAGIRTPVGAIRGTTKQASRLRKAS